MKKTHAFRLAVMPLWLLGFVASYAQLPQNYITKLSYMERTEVAYGLPEESSLYCITLGELSRYHRYMQKHGRTMDKKERNGKPCTIKSKTDLHGLLQD